MREKKREPPPRNLDLQNADAKALCLRPDPELVREIGSVAMCSGGGAMEYGTFLASELFAMSSAAVHTGRPISKRAASDVMCLL